MTTTSPRPTTKATPKPQDSPASDPLPELPPDQFQAIARALADPRRFAILQQIAANENLLCSHLDAQTCITPATISHHLRELHEAGLIDSRRDGRTMCLSLRRSIWAAYLRQLQAL